MAPHDANERSSDNADNNRLTNDTADNSDLTGGPSGGQPDYNRRSFLKLTGTVAGVTAGMAGAAAGQTTRHGISFDRVVDAVDDLGMDPNGNATIDAKLDKNLDTGTLIKFPPGEYLISDDQVFRGESRLGILGLGDGPRDVTFKAAKGYAGKWLNVGGGSEQHLIENVSLHERYDNDSGIALRYKASGTILKDVEWLGRTPTDHSFGYQITVDDVRRDGVSLVENVTAGIDAPANQAVYPNGMPLFRNSPSHEGEVIIRNMVAHQRNGSALRSTNMDGVVTVEGGEFVANSNSNLRFSAGHHPDKVSTADGTYIEMNSDVRSPAANEAVRVDASGGDAAGAIFRNLTINWKEVDRPVTGSPRGAIVLFNGHGRAEFYNCTVYNEDGKTVNSVDSANTYDDDIIIENCDFTGPGGDFDAGDRDGSVIRDSSIDMPNASFYNFETVNIDSNAEGLDGSNDGSDGTSDQPSLPNTLTVRGKGTPTNYRFEVTKDVIGVNNSIEDYDSINGSTVEGWVTTSTHVDEFEFSGELSTLEFIEGDAEVKVNGEAIEPTDGSNDDDSNTDSPRTLKVQGTGTPTRYTIEVSDSLEPKSDTVESYDDVSDSSVTGWVTEPSHVDEFTFTGEISSIEFIKGDADIYVGGQLVGSNDGDTTDGSGDGSDSDDSTDDSSSGDATKALKIQGTGTSTQYHLEVSDTLTGKSDTIESYDKISGSSVTGWVTEPSHVDEFTFTGEISKLTFYEGEADVYVDGEKVTPDNTTAEPTRTLKVQGTGTPTRYHIEVDDSLTGVNDSIESYDDVTSTSVKGWVTEPSHVDEFTFTGSVKTVEFYEGEADVYVDGQQISQQ